MGLMVNEAEGGKSTKINRGKGEMLKTPGDRKKWPGIKTSEV